MLTKALAFNAVAVTVFYVCGIIGMIQGIDRANLDTAPGMQCPCTARFPFQ